MSRPNAAILEKASWLRRVIQAHLPEGVYAIAYSSRSLMHERILVNGAVAIQHGITSWFRPLFRFFVGSRPAVLEVRVSPWLTVRSFHLLVDGQVLYCDRHRDFFDGQPPRTTYSSASADPLCPYCDRRLTGVGLDLAALPPALVSPDGPIGRPTGVFTFARRRRLALIVVGIMAVIAGIVLLAVLLWFMLRGNAGAADMHGLHSAGFIGVLLLGVGPIAFFFALRNRRLQAVTGSEGVALIENDAVSLCRWRDVETVQETQLIGEAQSVLPASVRGEDHFFRVRCRDGTALMFRNFLNDLPWLGQILQHETLPYLLPSAVAALDKGEVLYFGPLALDQEGVRSDQDRRLTWEELEDAKIANGMLTLTRKGKRRAWFKTPLGQVPNVHVLLALVRSFRKESNPDD